VSEFQFSAWSRRGCTWLPFRDARTMREPRLAAPAAFLLLFVSVAILAPALTPHDPNAQDLPNRFRPPAWLPGGVGEYLLGTDQLGRDLLSRLIMGSRVSLLVGFTTVSVGLVLGTIIGITAGYFEGMFDRLIMRLADIQLSFPYILLTLAIAAVFGAGLLTIILVLGVASWPAYARITRGATLSVKQREFVQAAIALGSPDMRLLVRHILPNIAGSLVILATLQVSQMMLSEAALSFLGVGVPISTPTWGGMLNEGQKYIFHAWWPTVFPGLVLTAVVVAFNFLGDVLGERLGT
jgi:peptide/nickel transport system permease protein